ncbi:MAG TPA: hypothetical protein VFH56_07165 [Acidimicrobiales bacterium]|nr:hypothetical protein [Acidimicrobiales bacterium]
MGKVWYCANCGYEVGGRGRCHSCREKLVASDLPELEPGNEDDEVGYRIGWWPDRDRGRLIEYLNVLQVMHRFEDEELVVGAEDEERVDDLLEELSLTSPPSSHDGDTEGLVSDEGEPADDLVGHDEVLGGRQEDGSVSSASQSVRLLADAARRLTADPTDMHADADVAEASAGVFMEDEFYGTDAETWAAVGRVTRRLLVALGAEEAMDDEIRLQASILSKLLVDVPDTAGAAGSTAGAQLGVGTVYELPEWLPEQRAHLSFLLDEHRIPHEWDGDDLVVSSDHEDEAETLFDSVGAPSTVRMNHDDEFEEDESRYRALEELFNTSGRLSSEPDNQQRQGDLEGWAAQIEGPAPVGMDEAHWLRILNKSHSLREAIKAGHDTDAIAVLASDLHGLLRTVV